MSNSNTKNTDAIAQAFGVIGNGTAEVKWVKDYTQGACTIKLDESRWGVVLPEEDDCVKLHEMGHVLFSGFEANAISQMLRSLGHRLVGLIEDARIDTQAGDWYRFDLKGDHGARLHKEGVGARDSVTDAVAAICYGLPGTLGETGRAVNTRFGGRLETVQTSADPWATSRLAYEIESIFKGKDELESIPEATPIQEPGPDQGDEGDGDKNKDGDRPIDLGPELEAEWERIKREASNAVRVARWEIAKKNERVDTTGDGSHDVEILNVEQEPVKLGSVSHLVLDETVGLGRQVKRHGQPTPDVWKLGLYGDTRVFTKPPKRKGRVVVLMDLSESMGCWCEEHRKTGWLAFQAAATVTAKLPEATLLGFCSSNTSNYIVPLSPGNQPVCRFKHPVPYGNPDCAALEYLRSLKEGNLHGTTAIVISDGEPAGPAPLGMAHMEDHTKALAHELAGSGVKFVSVLVNTTDCGLYPSDVVIEIGNESDLLRLTKAIEAIVGGQ